MVDLGVIRVTDGVYITRVRVRSVDDVLPYLGDRVQLVNTNCWKEVAFAAILALRAFERKTNHAKTLGGEFLLRLAGTLQIREAIERIGARPGENFLVVYGDWSVARELLERLEEIPLGDCGDVKGSFETSALVEVL